MICYINEMIESLMSTSQVVLPEILSFGSPIHVDSRGSFQRLSDARIINQQLTIKFQESFVPLFFNLARNTLPLTFRGVHYQQEPFSESNFIKVIRGSIYDLVVDIRKDSSNYLKHEWFSLRADDNKGIFIPKGFAHGYITLEKDTEICYVTDCAYSSEHEKGLNIKDPLLNICVPFEISKISKKDLNWKFLKDRKK